MRITAGLGHTDDYEAYCDAGAGEVFCGYVPERWAEACRAAMPLNRREVRWVGVQLGGESELLLLREKIARRGVEAALTFNAPVYAPPLYPVLGEIIGRCLSLGFSRFILADPALLVWLKRQGLTERMHIHLSGEFGMMNSAVLPLAGQLGTERIILPRSMPEEDMRAVITGGAGRFEYEAFLLNEQCHYHGGFCQSLHCDELPPMCRVPWRLSPDDAPEPCLPVREGLGESGCGLCAVRRLEQMGVGWLKVVGRGAFSENMVRDLRAARAAVELSRVCGSDAEYIRRMKKELFPDGCSGVCYYARTEEP